MFPKVFLYKEKIKSNAKNIVDMCNKQNISIVGVTKVLCGNPDIAKILKSSGIDIIGDSRIQNIKKMIEAGVEGPYMLLRIPMISELDIVLDLCDFVLVSEIKTIKEIDRISYEKHLKKKIIVMLDVGDLREGIWFKKYIDDFKEISKLKNIDLSGIGTNLGCFGGVLPSVENMENLIEIKNNIEKTCNLNLNIISGGNTAALPLIEKGILPKGINNFRLGESIINGTDVTNNRIVENNHQDTIMLEAEIVEMKIKPSIPIGEIGQDAFGRKPIFEDKGERVKAILAIGEQDIDPKGMFPTDEKIKILHASSDHTIIDLTETVKKYKVGDILRFRLNYSATLRAMTSEYVEKQII